MEDKKQIPKIDWKKLVGKCKDLCHRKDRLLIILLTGILLLVIAVPFSGEGDAETGFMHSGKTKDPSDNTSNEMAGNGNAETYADYLEQKLAKVLSEVHGVGQTEVMITMASSSEKILGADSESESESVKESDSQGGSRSTIQSRSSQTAIYDGGGSSQGAPYVTKELTPEVAGVIVIAEGGDDPVAVENIIEAVQALFEIDTHKIKVMKRNRKEESSVKHRVRRNQLVIAGLAIMIAAAGYLNYSGKLLGGKNQSKETSSDLANMELLDISEEDLSAANGDIKSNDNEEDGTVDGTPGEAVLTSGDASAVVAEAKVTREQVRAKNKESLMEIIDNKNLSDAQKQEAVDQLLLMTDLAEKEAAAETMLASKGFKEAVVSLTSDGADVVVSAAELSEANRAQIEDIVTRKTGVAAENIVINPVAATEN